MLWGDFMAVSASGNAAVFGTDNGFAAVWHLDADCLDASGNGHNGTDHGTAYAAGIIGTAKKFNGTDSIVVNGLLGLPQSLTLNSGWPLILPFPAGRRSFPSATRCCCGWRRNN